MKVLVVRQFQDRHTKDLHNVNEELTISQERFGEINSTVLGVFVEEVKQEPKEEKKPTSKKPSKKVGD